MHFNFIYVIDVKKIKQNIYIYYYFLDVCGLFSTLMVHKKYYFEKLNGIYKNFLNKITDLSLFKYNLCEITLK